MSIAGDTVLRGIIDRESLSKLKIDFYQREKLSRASRRDIWDGLESDTQLPDIELGMRGETFSVADDNSYVELLNPVFVIDGYQRVSTLIDWIAKTPDTNAHLGAIIHINTNPDWERNRFHILNTSRIRVSASLLLRNLKEENPGIATLYGLSINDKTFCLHNRVSWHQSMARTDLITGTTLVKTTNRLHAHLAPARHGSSLAGVLAASERITKRIGLINFRKNALYFWNTMDEMWEIKNHKSSTGIPHLKSTFLRVFVDILSDHIDFWLQPSETHLNIPYELKNKLKKFPVYDPEVVRLADSRGKGGEALYFLFVQHINSGKRTKRLVPRNARAQITIYEDKEEDTEAAAE